MVSVISSLLVGWIINELLHKNLSFPLRISSVNMTKSAVFCDLVTFTEEILNGKLHLLCNEFVHVSLRQTE